MFGTFGSQANVAANLAIAGGNSASVLGGLTAGDLAGLDVLWVLNSDNGAQTPEIGANFADISNFVSGGGLFIYHDRHVEAAANSLPGGGAISFTRLTLTSIDVENATPPITNGPGGIIDNATLDGGNFSNHGFAALGSLPGGATAILNNGTPGNIVDFYYSFGAGTVYYSTIPLDFYLGGGSNFAAIYAPNVVALADAGDPVPTPATLALFGLGALALAGARRKD